MPSTRYGIYILVLVEGPTQELDATAITAEAKYSKYYKIKSETLFKSAYIGSNSLLYAYGEKIYQFKTKYS